MDRVAIQSQVLFPFTNGGCGRENLDGGVCSDPVQLRHSSSLLSRHTDGFDDEANDIR